MACNYCNDAGCCTSDVNGEYCKKKHPNAVECPTAYPCDKVNNNIINRTILEEKEEEEKVQETNGFFVEYIYLIYTGYGVGGLIIFGISVYCCWSCYYEDVVKDFINEKLCCGMLEYFECVYECCSMIDDAIEKVDKEEELEMRERNIEEREKRIKMNIVERQEETYKRRVVL